MKHSHISGLLLIPCLLLQVLSTGCDNSDTDDIGSASDNIQVTAWPEVLAMVVASDYSTTTVSTAHTQTLAIQPSQRVIPSDSVCRYDAVTNQMYVVSRLGSGSVSLFNWVKGGLEWAIQYSVDATTNPQDIAVVTPQKAIIPRFDKADLLVIHPADGTVLGNIDISEYADADGLPEAAQALTVDGRVYVTLQRIDQVTWAPSQFSSVLIIDGATNAVTAQVKLNVKNPTGKLRFSDAMNGLVLVGTGAWGVLDGGIEVMGLNGALTGTLVTESTLGGDVSDAVIASATKGFAIVSVAGESGSNTHLVVFNPQTGMKDATLIVSNGYQLYNLELTKDGKLWVADRTPTGPGVRIFNVTDNVEQTAAPLGVGLPPSMICLVN